MDGWVGWLVGCLVGWLVSGWVGWVMDGLVGWLVGGLVCSLAGWCHALPMPCPCPAHALPMPCPRPAHAPLGEGHGYGMEGYGHFFVFRHFPLFSWYPPSLFYFFRLSKTRHVPGWVSWLMDGQGLGRAWHQPANEQTNPTHSSPNQPTH